MMLGKWAARLVRRPPSPLHPSSPATFKPFSSALRIEEESFNHYSTSHYYSIRIGEVLNTKYQVIGKLGYGSNSTVWLCRDLSAHRYVTIKVGKSDVVQRELEAYRHLARIKEKHAGGQLIRKLLDSFNLQNESASFLCLVHDPLSVSLERLRSLCPNGKLPSSLLKATLIHIFLALDFLHTHAKLIHADLQEKNIILGLEEEHVLAEFEQEEFSNPVPRIQDDERVIYESRAIRMPRKHGRPTITDFGEARFGHVHYTDCIQPFQYRAPEVILNIPWSYGVDIWNVGVLIWDLFERKLMFSATDADGKESVETHLAQMVALLGPPPCDMVRESETAQKYFNSDGSWKGLAEIPETSLEASEEILEGDDKARFLRFLRRMMQWKAEDRSSAVDLLNDDWLHS